jgi:aryl-alcohol dehydrogenase-like predicted oxidoreductase
MLSCLCTSFTCLCRYFDAACSYGRAEEFLGGWLAARGIAPQEVVVGSKWGYVYTANWQGGGLLKLASRVTTGEAGFCYNWRGGVISQLTRWG